MWKNEEKKREKEREREREREKERGKRVERESLKRRFQNYFYTKKFRDYFNFEILSGNVIYNVL